MLCVKYIILSVLLLITVNAQQPGAKLYFPLTSSASWTYISAEDTTIETVISEDPNEKLYTFDSFRHTPNTTFRIEGMQVYHHTDTADYLWYDFAADSGDTWEAEGLVRLVSKNDTIRFGNIAEFICYHFYHERGADWVFEEWFAEGTGIVKRAVIRISGPLDYYLTGVVLPSVNEETINPADIVLHQNYPNPFNPSTNIKYYIPAPGKVVIKVYDLPGREIAELVNSFQQSGEHFVNFSNKDLTSGIYFYSLTYDSGNRRTTQTKKLLVIK